MLPKREAQRHKDAFEAYYEMPKRSLVKLAERCSVSAATTMAWSRAFSWADRIKERDAKAREKTEEKVTDAIAKVRARHAERFTKIEEQFFTELEHMAPEKAQEAFTIFKGAVEGLRQAIGLPDQHIEHSGGVKVVFEDVESDAKRRDGGESKKD